ncbi:hypothetical protein RSB1_gp15 [Ralstonia phage RSB1]|uniref:Uncharacterized protein n=1 Tax=Ralstonia phage RSB1 TaxID=551790 RepID=B5BTV1_9CAUD|nr:hypothetical protein RSB1_gp15 [Ralstonia phage RSB1]BAG70373.1 hypothetical protein [Ralstonia phage RSB1]
MKLKNAYAGLIVEAKRNHDSQTGAGPGIEQGERYEVDDIDYHSGGTGELRLIAVGRREQVFGWHDAEHVRKAR